MLSRKYLLFALIGLGACMLSSCDKYKDDYRHDWLGEYSYTTNRDGGMEGVVYVGPVGTDQLHIFIDGINDLMCLSVSEDGSLHNSEPNLLCANLSGGFDGDNLDFSFTNMAASKTYRYNCQMAKRVRYGNRNRNGFPTDYRDKWVGSYDYTTNYCFPSNLCSPTLEIYKISYAQIGIYTGYDNNWKADVDEQGVLSGKFSIDDPNDRNEIRGAFVEPDSLWFGWNEVLQPGLFENHFYCKKVN